MNYCASSLEPVEDHQNWRALPLSCRLDGLPPQERLQSRLQILSQLGLLESTGFPIMEEATQMASRFLNVPICVLSIVDAEWEIFKAATGLSQLGLMNPLSQSRRLSLADSLAAHVLDSKQPLIVEDIRESATFRTTLLAQYGVRAYAGVPLNTSQGDCIGTLAIMALSPRSFSYQEKTFLELIARWSISEHERGRLQKQVSLMVANLAAQGPIFPQSLGSVDSLRLNLLNSLTQELRSPLTSIMGMATMLSREIYGPLTAKQREYTNVVLSGGKTLVKLIDEMIEIETLDKSFQPLNPVSTDIAMLGQQVLKTLEPIAQKQRQELQLSVEPGPRIYCLDNVKVKQLLHYLVLSVIQMAGENSTVRVHFSRRQDYLHLSVWLSNRWLGEGLPQYAIKFSRYLENSSPASPWPSQPTELSFLAVDTPQNQPPALAPAAAPPTRDLLHLLLSRYITELHQGTIRLQGNPEAGYRFVVQIPVIPQPAEVKPADAD